VNWDAEQFSTRAQQMGCCAGASRTPYIISAAEVMKREPASMECRAVMDVLVTVASSCRHHETVISSLLNNLVPCHQFCLCGIKFIAHGTSTETGLSA
jgi:hypothetical protein